MPVCACTSRPGQGAGQPHPGRGRSVAELSAPARTRRCPGCRRSVRGGRLGTDSGADAAIRRRWSDGPVGAPVADRREPGRAGRLQAPHPGDDRRAGNGVAVTAAGPLAGIRILEVGTMLAGPYATMLLADLGAEVTKIEPRGGEISRGVSDSYFASLNRNKASICLDLNSNARSEEHTSELQSHVK